MAKRKRQAPYVTYIAGAIVAGIAIGALKFAVDDFVGFSLIVIFSLIYGTALFFMLHKMSGSGGSIWRTRMATALAVIAIASAVVSYYAFDYKYTEYQGIQYFASQGEDTSGMYLSFEGYLESRGSMESSVGYLLPILPVTGFGIFVLDAVEFIVLAYACLRGVRGVRRPSKYDWEGEDV